MIKRRPNPPGGTYYFLEDSMLREWTFDVQEVAPYTFRLRAKKNDLFRFEIISHNEEDLIRMATTEAEYCTKQGQ